MVQFLNKSANFNFKQTYAFMFSKHKLPIAFLRAKRVDTILTKSRAWGFYHPTKLSETIS